jgi:hypothetical protein
VGGGAAAPVKGAAGDDAFTFGDLSAERATLMKVCPVR